MDRFKKTDQFLKTDRCFGYLDVRMGSLIYGYIGVVVGVLGVLRYLFLSSERFKTLEDFITKANLKPEVSLLYYRMYQFPMKKSDFEDEIVPKKIDSAVSRRQKSAIFFDFKVAIFL